MDPTIQEFLKNHRISVIGVVQVDNSVHSATLHYAHLDEPLSVYFLTDKASRKCRPLVGGKPANASLVIGFSEEEFCTFQAEGTVEIVDEDAGWDVYLGKYPSRSKFKDAPDLALLKFTPTWWRYTDMKTASPTRISSEK